MSGRGDAQQGGSEAPEERAPTQLYLITPPRIDDLDGFADRLAEALADTLMEEVSSQLRGQAEEAAEHRAEMRRERVA